MLGVVGSIAGLIKIHSNNKVLVDDAIFRLHYRLTTSLFFLACAMIAASDLVGSAIQCLDGKEEASKPVTTYCWVMNTFTINSTIPDYYVKGPYHSVGSNFSGLGNPTSKHEIRVHAYYQWVPIILFLVGCMFYLPHILWKEIEGKRVDSLLQGLNVISMDESSPVKKTNIVNYIMASKGRLNVKYAFGYFFMQICNIVNVLFVMFMLDKFFGDIFMEFGTRAIQYWNNHPDIEHDPLITAFPRIAKCNYMKFGSSGTVETRDVLCLLPQNILNEKLFIFFWFWMIILLTFTCMKVVYLALLFLSPFLRQKLMEQQGKMVSSSELEALIKNLNIGDYFLLLNIAKNVDAICFKDILEHLIKVMVPLSAINESKSGAKAGLMYNPNAPSYKTLEFDKDNSDTTV